MVHLTSFTLHGQYICPCVTELCIIKSKEDITMTILRTMNRDDNVFATLSSYGKTVKSIVGRNFTSINDVIKMMTTGCKDFRGLAQLSIRNQTQGWSMNMLLRIDNRASKTANQPATEQEPPHDGLQYRFAF